MKSLFRNCMIYKKAAAVILSAVLVFSSCTSCTQKQAEVKETKQFTDSLGRTVTVDKKIERVALTGPLAQIVLFALCPDKLVGLSDAWSSEAEKYLDEKYLNMLEIGQLRGGKGELNLETLLSLDAQVIIDVGEPKTDFAQQLDDLQSQCRIPVVHITAYTDNTADAYRMLGDLLDMRDEAEELASYYERIYERGLDIAQHANKKGVLYITGAKGLNVIAKGSYHAEIIDLMTENLAVLESPSSKGDGNEVDMETILSIDPEYLIFDPTAAEVFRGLSKDPVRNSLEAVRSGRCLLVPAGPYNWMGFPPSVQRLLGIMWLEKMLYPETADYDLYEEVREYYELFYHCNLSRQQYNELIGE